MSENNQTISALMDDEHDSLALDKLIQDEDMQNTWSRYHLIGDCLRDSLTEQVDVRMAERVSQALQNEPTVLAPSSKSSFNFKPLAGFAIAASVAMVAILGIQNSNNNNGNVGVPAAPAIANNETAIPAETIDTFRFGESQVLPASIKSDTPATLSSQRMNGYLVNHNEYRSASGMTGIPPYVRIVTIEPQSNRQE